MKDKTFKKNKTKETTDSNLNDLEINDNSAKDNLITTTRIDCINGNLEITVDELNVPLEILANDNKETQTKNNCEYVTTELFDAFYNDYIDFKHYINNILNILNENFLHLRKNQVFQSKYCCWRSRSEFSNLKTKNFRKREKLT